MADKTDRRRTASKEPINIVDVGGRHNVRARDTSDEESLGERQRQRVDVKRKQVSRNDRERKSGRPRHVDNSTSTKDQERRAPRAGSSRKQVLSKSKLKRPLTTAAAGSIQDSHVSDGSGKKRKSNSVHNQGINERIGSQNSIRSSALVTTQNQRNDMSTMNLNAELMDLLKDQTMQLNNLSKRITRIEEQNKELIGQVSKQNENEGSVTSAAQKGSQEETMKEKFERIMGGRLILLNELFCTKTVVKSIFRVLCMKTLTYSKENVMELPQLRQLLKMLLFSLNGNLSKQRNEEQVSGKEICALKRMIVTDWFKRAQTNAYQIFSDDNTESVQQETRPRRPYWLKANSETKRYYISAAELIPGFDRREKRSVRGDTGMKRRNQIATAKITPSTADDGEYIGHSLYGKLTSHLNGSRRLIIGSLYESIMYLFYDWVLVRRHSDIIDRSYEIQRNTSLRLKWKDSRLQDPLSFKSIPITQTSAAAAKENYEKYEKFVQERTDVQLCVEHDVAVGSSKGGERIRKRKGKERKTWKRVLTLMDAAATLLQSFSGHEKYLNVNEMLQESEYSISAVYLIALSLRQFIEKQNTVVVELSDNDCTIRRPPTNEERECVDDVLKMLKPNNQAKEKGLASNVYAVSRKIYDTHNITDKPEEDPENVATKDVVNTEMTRTELDDLRNAAASLFNNTEKPASTEAAELLTQLHDSGREERGTPSDLPLNREGSNLISQMISQNNCEDIDINDTPSSNFNKESSAAAVTQERENTNICSYAPVDDEENSIDGESDAVDDFAGSGEEDQTAYEEYGDEQEPEDIAENTDKIRQGGDE